MFVCLNLEINLKEKNIPVYKNSGAVYYHPPPTHHAFEYKFVDLSLRIKKKVRLNNNYFFGGRGEGTLSFAASEYILYFSSSTVLQVYVCL